MNIQKGFVNILLILLGLLIVSGGGYFFLKNNSIKEKLQNDEVKKETELPAIDNDQIKNSTTSDMYQNGKYPGIIKSVYLDNKGKVLIDVDFYQGFSGKQAFLELAKDLYYSEKNKNTNWDEFKTKYPTYLELERFVNTMNEERFDDYYSELTWKDNERSLADDKRRILIAGNFPNGMIYNKNESTKIRTFPLDKNTTISIDLTSPETGIDSFEINQSQFIEKFKLRAQDEFMIDIENGVVKNIVSIFRP